MGSFAIMRTLKEVELIGMKSKIKINYYRKEKSVGVTFINTNSKEQKLFARWNIADRLLHISANDAQMVSLYRHALCFVFPSHYEGFGIPILEAFNNNCPVCLSNASCFPEVAGDAAMFFNPNDAQSMHDTLKEVLASSTLREELRQKGALRSKEFSLERMVEQTCDVYRKL